MLEIRKLRKSFNLDRDNILVVFDEFNLNLKANTTTALIGPNGCGKTTLLNLISGNLKSDNGTILLNGIDITNEAEEKRSIQISRVHQDPSKSVSLNLTVLENLALADKKGESFNLYRLIRKQNRDRYMDLLKSFNIGLENKINEKVKYLSGGQRQSLSLIMASMKNPNILLLDEHTAALDPKASVVVLEKTKELIKKNKITTLMVSHNIKDALRYSDRIIMLDSGNIVFDRPSISIKESEILDIYKEKLQEKFAS
ncbi:MAG: ATP-binding cassette domain-containing protein [Tissierellales bacterium]|nr:ATP-binding cassette domain-containing protein [Tissierellales bacterium]